MTPCTPHTHPTLSASSSSISPTTATEQPQPRTPGGGDFTWAALSTTPRNPATPPESPAAVPLHRQATLTQQPSRREIRRLERRGSWVLARQRSVCQCAGPQEGAGGGGNGAVPAASAASPSTRMYLCEECNGAVVTSPGAGAQEGHTQQAHGQEGEGKGAGRTQGPRLLLVLLAAAAGAAAIGLLLLPHTHNATPTCLLGWTLLWALTQHIFLPSLLPPPAHIPATHLWGQALTGVTQAVLASLAAVGLLLLPLPLRPETAAWARQQLRLASCGYYCLALASSSASVAIAGKQERHLHVSRAWQALLLALHVGLLLLQSEWGGQQLRGHQQRVGMYVS